MYNQRLTLFLLFIYFSATKGKESICIEDSGEFCEWSEDSPGEFQWRTARCESYFFGLTGPSGDSSLSASGYYLLADASDNSAGKIAEIRSQNFTYELEKNTDFCVEVHYNMFGANVGKLRLKTIIAESEKDWTSEATLWEIHGNQSRNWIKSRKTVDLSNLTSSGYVQFALTATMGNGHLGDIAIDGLNVTNKNCSELPDEIDQKPLEDKQAGNFTLDMFIFYLQIIENKYQELTPREIAHKLRIVAGYDNDFWRQLLYGLKYNKSSVIAPFEEGKIDEEIFKQLHLMLQHNTKWAYESGVVKNHDETIAFGHVITGLAAGYDRRKLKKYIMTIDNLFAATISGDLGQSAIVNHNDSGSPIIGPKGVWINGKDYLCDTEVGEATHAEIIGDIDGFNLGHLVTEDISKPISEHLKEYYCKKSSQRFEIFMSYTDYNTLKDEVQTFLEAYAVKVSNVSILKLFHYTHSGETAINAFCEKFQQLEDWCWNGRFLEYLEPY